MKIIGQLKAILGLDKTSFDRGLNQAEKKTNAFANTIKKIGGIMAAAFSVGALISFSKEAMKVASTAEGIRTAFEKLNKPDLLDQLRKATRGTVGDVTLMQKAVQAKNFKIPLEQLATYFEFATKRAIQTGESVNYLVDSIITGIGRKSVLVMDNLGISAVELQTETQKLGDFGTAAGVIIRRELTSMGDVADTTAIKMAKLAVAGESLKEAWGTWLNKSPVIDAFRSYFTDLLKAWADESNTFMQKAAILLPFYGGQKNEKAVWKRGQAQTEKERAAEGVNPAGSTGLQKLLENAEVPAKKLGKTIADLRIELDEYKKQLEATTISDKTHRLEILQKTYALEKQLEALTNLKTQVEKIEKVSTGNINKPSVSGGFPAAPGIQKAPGEPSEAEKSAADIRAMTEELQNQQVAVDILSSAFDTLFTSTEDGFKNMIDSIISGLKRLVAELLARTAVLLILNAITGGGASFGKILKTAASFIFPGAAKGAQGLTVPQGYPSDTFPALLSSGETVLTAQESKRFNKGLEVHVTGEIAGRAIALMGRRTEREN